MPVSEKKKNSNLAVGYLKTLPPRFIFIYSKQQFDILVYIQYIPIMTTTKQQVLDVPET